METNDDASKLNTALEAVLDQTVHRHGGAPGVVWAGLANCFYWIDKQSGVGGYWASQILPFQDCASYPGFVDFETAVYHHR